MQRTSIIIALMLCLVGCQSSQEFHGGRNEIFDAAEASVPMTVGGMKLTASDRAAGTFEGLLVDGFGNVYLRGRVLAAEGAATTINVNCWEWSLKTVFLFPLDAKWAEQQFLEAVNERLESAPSTPAAMAPLR